MLGYDEKMWEGPGMLSALAFPILEIDFPWRCTTISGSALSLEVVRGTDDLSNEEGVMKRLIFGIRKAASLCQH